MLFLLIGLLGFIFGLCFYKIFIGFIPTKDNEVTRYRLSFKGKNQLPLIMLVREDYDSPRINFAKCLFDCWFNKEIKRKYYGEVANEDH